MAKAKGSTSGSGADVSDEQWIVNQANFYRNSDLHAAKSWLIVGRTLFSRNFEIQVLSFVFVASNSNSSIDDVYCCKLILGCIAVLRT